MKAMDNIYEQGLDACDANFVPLSPLSFIERTARIYPDSLAVIHGPTRRTWSETYGRTCALASALSNHGVEKGQTVSIMAANIPELFEAHFGVPMSGAVLNAINTRLDAKTVAFILDHSEAKVFIVDPEYSEIAAEAVALSSRADLLVIDIEDPTYHGGRQIGSVTYGEFLETGDDTFNWNLPENEWNAISLNYTSGTTGNPKGVVYHHRGAHLNATSHIVDWEMQRHATYLWTLPMFHCNGWCFPWTIAAVAGVNVCLRAVRAEPIFELLQAERVTHFCGAPIVLNMLANAPDELKTFEHKIKVMTAGASPPAAVIEKMENMGVEVTHVYGLTETYGPSVVSSWKSEWDGCSTEQRARLKARQGVNNSALLSVMVAEPGSLSQLPQDGQSLGEIFMRGNNVMRGYLKNGPATEAAFAGGWFASGDLGVMHPDGYVELKDRAKDIIISGGENISSVEIEDVLYRHPCVEEAAVVAKPDEKWGETPCAFISVKLGTTVTADDIIGFCREHLAGFKVPKAIIFCELPKTSTGKVQKFVLREKAKEVVG